VREDCKTAQDMRTAQAPGPGADTMRDVPFDDSIADEEVVGGSDRSRAPRLPGSETEAAVR
jgi:hypothetical protein